jgi:hypothetical protein
VTAWLTAALGVVGALLLAALGDLLSEEVRGWLDLVPRAILRLAATQLNPAQRDTIYRDEWLPELSYILRGAETRPITRLIIGIRYASGLLIAARRIAHGLNRTLIAERATKADGLYQANAEARIQAWLKAAPVMDRVELLAAVKALTDHDLKNVQCTTWVRNDIWLRYRDGRVISVRDLVNAAATYRHPSMATQTHDGTCRYCADPEP